MRRNRSLSQHDFASAISLCQRGQGATTEDLETVMTGRASFDCPYILRRYLKRYRPDLEMVGKRLPHKAKSKWRGKLHGNRLTYFIIAARRGGPDV